MFKKLILIGGLTLSLVACSNEELQPVADEITPVEVIGFQELIKDELYYIKSNNDIGFPTQYNNFIKTNPHLKLIDVESDPRKSTYNTLNGWYLFVETKEDNN